MNLRQTLRRRLTARATAATAASTTNGRFASDTFISAYDFQNHHPQSRRVVVDAEKMCIVSLCVIRHARARADVVESDDTIHISATNQEYTRLHDVEIGPTIATTTTPCREEGARPKSSAPFPVFAWDVEKACGFSRGLFQLKRDPAAATHSTFFVLERYKTTTGDDDDDPHPKLVGSASTNVKRRAAPSPTTSTATTGGDGGSDTTEPLKRARKDPAIFGMRTVLNGVTFKSRKEARFAYALTHMDIRFAYEPMTFRRPCGGTYRPDFFLPAQQLWIELKPQRPHIEEEQRCEEMSSCGFRVVCMYGDRVGEPPFRSEAQSRRESRGARDYRHKDGLRGMAWLDGVKLPGETVFVVGPLHHLSSYNDPTDEQTPRLDQVVTTSDTRWCHNRVLHALEAAENHKFE